MATGIITNLCMLICAAIGTLYGGIVFFVRKSPLYAKMITGAVGCLTLSKLLVAIRDLAAFETSRFTPDTLGYIGVFLFLLCANAGLMNSLADDGSAEFLRYRIIAFLAPLAVTGLYVLILVSDISTSSKVIFGIVSAVAGAASYYHLKHAIFPDVDFGVMKCVRPYNYLALGYVLLHMGEMIASAYNSDMLLIIVTVPICIISLIILPTLRRGIEKWKT